MMKYNLLHFKHEKEKGLNASETFKAAIFASSSFCLGIERNKAIDKNTLTKKKEKVIRIRKVRVFPSHQSIQRRAAS